MLIEYSSYTKSLWKCIWGWTLNPGYVLLVIALLPSEQKAFVELCGKVLAGTLSKTDEHNLEISQFLQLFALQTNFENFHLQDSRDLEQCFPVQQ